MIVSFVIKSAYLAIMFVIGIGEFALNAQASQVFQKPLILTVLMAATIGVGIPWSAHGCGILIKQWPKPAWKTGLWLGVILAGVVGGLVAINAARGAY